MRNYISTERLDIYEQHLKIEAHQVSAAYHWNKALAGAMLPAMQWLEVTITMKKMLLLIFAKWVYNEKKNETTKSTLNIIIDEAHNILSNTSFRETESWKDYRLETLENIWLYGQIQFCVAKADEYVARFSEIFDILAKHEIGTQRPELGENIFSLPIEKHVIFFVPSESSITVIRILNQSQDVIRHISWR